jgi:hypothetical protein
MRHEEDGLVASGSAYIYAAAHELGVDLTGVPQATVGGS